jgi:hypothetical protein
MRFSRTDTGFRFELNKEEQKLFPDGLSAQYITEPAAIIVYNDSQGSQGSELANGNCIFFQSHILNESAMPALLTGMTKVGAVKLREGSGYIIHLNDIKCKPIRQRNLEKPKETFAPREEILKAANLLNNLENTHPDFFLRFIDGKIKIFELKEV